MTQLQREIKQKTDELAGRFGMMVDLATACKIFGCKSPNTAARALRELQVEPVRICGKARYETDRIARRIVELRGMG